MSQILQAITFYLNNKISIKTKKKFKFLNHYIDLEN